MAPQPRSKSWRVTERRSRLVPSPRAARLGLLLLACSACGDGGIVVGDLVREHGATASGGAGVPDTGAPARGGAHPAGGASAGSSGVEGGRGGHGGEPSRARPFILGADISWVDEEEDEGTVYVDEGVEKDLLELLRDHGFNFIRLRLFHEPSSPCRESIDGDQTCGYQFELANRAEPYCDLEHTVVMAQRAKALGLGLLLDFHYSDTWADPDDQNKPLAWEALGFDELVVAIEDYTAESLQAFAEAGALPDIVQLGNEITPGMLFPDGSNGDPGNWDRFAALLHAATAGVREVSAEIRIMLHIEKPDSFTTSDWWLQNALDQGLDFDILGQSCFTEWHGPPSGWEATLERLATKYSELDFLVAEYSQEKRAVNDLVYNLPGERGLGTFIWEPTAWRETLFDRQGNQLVANDWMRLYDQMADEYGAR